MRLFLVLGLLVSMPCFSASFDDYVGVYRGHTQYSWNDCEAVVSKTGSNVEVRVITQDYGSQTARGPLASVDFTISASGEVSGISFLSNIYGVGGNHIYGTRDTELLVQGLVLNSATIQTSTQKFVLNQDHPIRRLYACYDLVKRN